MIYFLHFLLAINLFAAAFAGAFHLKFVRKVRHLSFVYFGWSLTGQIIALPLMILTLLSLGIAIFFRPSSQVIPVIHVITLALFALILWRSWQASQVLAKIAAPNGYASILRFMTGALFPIQLPNRHVRRTKNIRYGPAKRRNLLDIYRPKNLPSAPMPVLIHVHGGGWVVGSKHQQAQPLIQHMAAQGWLVIDINYRLGPWHKMPAMIQDVLRAIAWVKANIASYDGDPNFVAVTGGSAGGHLVALAALASDISSFKPGFEKVDCTVNACVPVYGLYDILDQTGTMEGGQQELESFLKMLIMPGSPKAQPDLWNDISPINHISPDAPPMLFLHGQHDALADLSSAKGFSAALKSVSKNAVIFAEVPGRQHAYDIVHTPPTAEHVRAIYRFLSDVYRQSGTERSS